MILVGQKHFATDKDQHQCEPKLEVFKVSHGPRQKKIKRAKPQDGKDIGGENDEWITSHTKNGRNGIHRKNQVRGFDHHQYQRQRR